MEVDCFLNPYPGTEELKQLHTKTRAISKKYEEVLSM